MENGKLKINYLAVALTGIAAFLLSLVWYSPLLFGKIWELYRHRPNNAVPQWTLTFAPLREMIASFTIAWLIVQLNLIDWKVVLRLMLLLWVAFHEVGMAGAILWDNMQWQLGAVHAGDWLMKMLFMGVALTIWINKSSANQKN
jgi:hypothetical protein